MGCRVVDGKTGSGDESQRATRRTNNTRGEVTWMPAKKKAAKKKAAKKK